MSRGLKRAALIRAALLAVPLAWASLALASGELPLDRFAAEVEAAYPATPTLTVATFMARADRAHMLIIDARTDPERAVSQIPGAISTQELRERLDALAGQPADQANPQAVPPLLVYCTIGMRSAELTRELGGEGFAAFNLRGGVLAWAAAGQPFVDANGNATHRVHVYGRRWNQLPSGYEAVW